MRYPFVPAIFGSVSSGFVLTADEDWVKMKVCGELSFCIIHNKSIKINSAAKCTGQKFIFHLHIYK